MRSLSYLKQIIATLSLVVFLSSCEEPINIVLKDGQSQLAVDALVIVNDGPQKIRLTMTNYYFDNKNVASGASGATVTLLSNQGKSYSFIENSSKAGDYLSSDTVKGNTGELFTLRIDYRGEQFIANSVLVRGTVIDTLFVEDRESEFGNEKGKYFSFNARDSVGFGDFCWIRYKLNGMPDLRYNRLGSAFPADAAFNPGNADGLEFIYPIRNSINGDKSYLLGDVMELELLSIDAEQWRFLKEMEVQLNNTGLFANPIANVRGNIFNANPSSKIQAVGCFGMSRASKARAEVQ